MASSISFFEPASDIGLMPIADFGGILSTPNSCWRKARSLSASGEPALYSMPA
jgi:hypothetical protein